MEYVYAALLLDAAGKEVNEQDLINVVKAAGFTPDEAKAKAIASSLKGVNIKDVIKNAQASRAVAAAPAAAQPEQAKASSLKGVNIKDVIKNAQASRAVAAAPAAAQPEQAKAAKKEEKEEKKSEEEAAGGLASLFG